MSLRSIFARTLALAAFALAFTLGAQAQSTPQATVQQWMVAFNTGDMAKAATFNAASTTIIDEFAPFSWTGPKAFDDWAAGYAADMKAHDVTESKVTMGPVIASNITAAHAYLTYSAVYTFMQKGVAMRENGHDAIVLRKEGGTWKVVSWAWTGGVAKPVK